MTTYKYWPLDAEQRMIRLVTIHPGALSDDITVSLQHVHLDSFSLPPSDTTSASSVLGYRGNFVDTNYEAAELEYDTKEADDVASDTTTSKLSPTRYECLSYTWGSEEDPLAVRVESPPSLSNTSLFIVVTRNLDAALRHIRHVKGPRVFFIDALCIDQQNVEERGEQVALMGEVYRRAARTIVWLGPVGDDSDHALDVLQDIASRFRARIDYAAGVVYRNADLERFWLEWLMPLRLEVEEDRDRRAVFHLLGRAWFSRLWVRQEVAISRLLHVICGRKQCAWSVIEMCGMLLFMIGKVHGCSELDSLFSRRRAMLLRLIKVRRGGIHMGGIRWTIIDLGFKDARDVLYGLMGLFRGNSELLNLKPDYTKSVVELFKDVVIFKAVQDRNLSILEECELASISLPGLPTWTPDFSRPKLTTCDIATNWSACAWLSAHAEVLEDETLRVAAVRACVVNAVVTRSDADKNGNDCRHVTPHIDSPLAKLLRATLGGYGTDEPYVAGGTVVAALAGLLGPRPEQYETYLEEAPTIAAIERALNRTEEPEIQNEDAEDTRCRIIMGKNSGEVKGRCFFWCEKGYVGAGPESAQPGDVVYVVLGCDRPLLLRPTSSDKAARWQIIGHVTVPGFMEGEAITGPWGEFRGGYSSDSLKPIKGIRVGMRDSRDGTILSDPAEILEMNGIKVNQYVRQPHLVDVDLEELRANDVQIEYLDLV